MTDLPPDDKTPRGGKAKASLSGLYVIFTLNVTPPIVGYFYHKWPLFNEAFWFEVVTLVLGGIGGFFVWATPQHFVEAVDDAIEFAGTTWYRWKQTFKKAFRITPPQ